MMKDWCLDTSLPQLDKGLSSSGSKKTHFGAKKLGLSQKKLYQIFAFVFILTF